MGTYLIRIDMKHYEDYQQRVVDERVELEEKLLKLQTFLISEKSNSLDSVDRKLLTRQAAIMLDYSEILSERIDRF